MGSGHQMDPVVNVVHNIEVTQLHAVQALAAQVYSSDVVLPLEVLERWYLRNNKLWWVATLGEETIGYLCVIPLTKEAFRWSLMCLWLTFSKTLLPDFDEDLSTADICQEDECHKFMYYCSVVVHPSYRGKAFSVYNHLTVSFLQRYTAI